MCGLYKLHCESWKMERHLSEGVCLAMALELITGELLSLDFPSVFAVHSGANLMIVNECPYLQMSFLPGQQTHSRHVEEHLSVHQAELLKSTREPAQQASLKRAERLTYLVNAGDMAARHPTLAYAPGMSHAFLPHPVLNSHPVLLWLIPLPQHSGFPLVSVLVGI